MHLQYPLLLPHGEVESLESLAESLPPVFLKKYKINDRNDRYFSYY